MILTIGDRKTIWREKLNIIPFSLAPLIPTLPMGILLIVAILKNKNNFLDFVGGKGFYITGVLMCALGIIVALVTGLFALETTLSSRDSRKSEVYKNYLSKNSAPKTILSSISTFVLSIFGIALFSLVFKNYKHANQVLNALTVIGAIVGIGFIGLLIYSIVDFIIFSKKLGIENLGNNNTGTQIPTPDLPTRTEVTNPRFEPAREEWTREEIETKLSRAWVFDKYTEPQNLRVLKRFRTFEGFSGEILNFDGDKGYYNLTIGEGDNTIQYKMQGLDSRQ